MSIEFELLNLVMTVGSWSRKPAISGNIASAVAAPPRGTSFAPATGLFPALSAGCSDTFAEGK